jgi:hypothetical protein
MNDSTELPRPNIPLLRKAVEWAEAEAAKTDGTCLWDQREWVTYTACGTAYCIAGFAVTAEYGQVGYNRGYAVIDGASLDFGLLGTETLGLTDVEAADLFDGCNSIEDVRRVAEQIAARAGERL